MLLLRMGDVYLSGRISLNYEIKILGILDKIRVKHLPYLSTALVYPGFLKNNPKARQYADMMTDGIRRLGKTGRLAKILSAYGLTDWVEEN